jgi:pyridoxamine 5'-phosphate oxidase
MILSTVDKNLMPDSRVVLLRNVSLGGLTFYTNYESKKGQDISKNSNASVLFFWKELERQVRIQGRLSILPAKISDNNFESRPFESKVGACISTQSSVVKSRRTIDKLYENALKDYESQEVPRPEHWGGYVLIPITFEFWQGRSNRLHDRVQYVLNDGKWSIQRLMP